MATSAETTGKTTELDATDDGGKLSGCKTDVFAESDRCRFYDFGDRHFSIGQLATLVNKLLF